MLYEKFRPRTFTPAPRRLTEELWQKSIIHPREDKAVGADLKGSTSVLSPQERAADHGA